MRLNEACPAIFDDILDDIEKGEDQWREVTKTVIYQVTISNR